MNKNLLLNYLNCRRLLLSPEEGVSGLYHTLCDVSPEFYVHLLAEVASDATRKREVMILLLQGQTVYNIGRRSLRSSLCRVPAHRGRGVEGIRCYRSRAHQCLLPSLDGYGVSPQMAAIRKQYVMRLLKHALGERSWLATSSSPTRDMPDTDSYRDTQPESFAWYAAGRYRAGA